MYISAPTKAIDSSRPQSELTRVLLLVPCLGLCLLWASTALPALLGAFPRPLCVYSLSGTCFQASEDTFHPGRGHKQSEFKETTWPNDHCQGCLPTGIRESKLILHFETEFQSWSTFLMVIPGPSIHNMIPNGPYCRTMLSLELFIVYSLRR